MKLRIFNYWHPDVFNSGRTNGPPLRGYKQNAAMRLETGRRYAANNRLPLCGY
jgi:hypothetical protein